MNSLGLPHGMATKSTSGMTTSSSDSKLSLNQRSTSPPTKSMSTSSLSKKKSSGKPRRNSDPDSGKTTTSSTATTASTASSRKGVVVSTKSSLADGKKSTHRPHPFLNNNSTSTSTSSSAKIKKPPTRGHPFLDGNKKDSATKKKPKEKASGTVVSDVGSPSARRKQTDVGSPSVRRKQTDVVSSPTTRRKQVDLGSPATRRKQAEMSKSPPNITGMEWNREFTPRVFAKVSPPKTSALKPISSPKLTIKRAADAQPKKKTSENSKKFNTESPSSRILSTSSSTASLSRSKTNGSSLNPSLSVGDFPRSPSKVLAAKGKKMATSKTTSALPPRSMPRVWVESGAKGSRKKSPKQKKEEEHVAVLRHELFRDSFRLNPNNMGITGEDIDREFCMSDTYKGNYTFKVRGPGMMGPFLDEDSSEPLAEGSRSYLHEGGTTLIGFKARREYWVEIMSDPDAFGSEIKEAILRTETEIARIDLKAKDIVDLVDQQQAKDTSDLMEKQQQQQQQQQQLQQVLDGDDLGALQSTLNDMTDTVVVKVERNTTTTITYTSDSDDEL